MKTTTNDKTTPDKNKMFKTAYATVACACIKVGDCVSVEFSHYGNNGLAWFYIDRSQHGQLPHKVAYPANHLKDFCL
jgi:hypothetical protein